ncbi:hypothetical protein BKA82DRAFT_28844 [Pisolithus tinctorius]|uniref:Uncharacterized protein n=1 Tax=Pisolithus tinctorius Marx 270 TaxID=870435 RepID=A0A0C3NK19_PISTI|nr:hypothetical protein BKA82DRAFT_28844 [Pisolithus tinctorius]KIO01305.1 hypothetical protein M404DRAFT_28844 [Pisolithus tinctorius Marx 270]
MRQEPPPEYRDVAGLKEEIANLVGKVDAIDKQFLQIRQALSETILDPNDQFKKFRELVWKSREIAAKASAAIKDFCGDLLTHLLAADITNDEKVKELEAVIKYWQGSGEIDSQMGQDFDNLCDALGDFSTTIRKRLEDVQAAERALKPEIDELNKEIARCESGSSRYMGVRTGAGLTFTLTSEALRVSILASQSILRGSPCGAIEVVSTSLKEGTANLLHLLEAPGGGRPELGQLGRLTHTMPVGRAKDALMLQLSARLDALRTTQCAIDKSAAILKDVDNLKCNTSALSSELTCLNDVYNLLTKEALELVDLMNADPPGVDYKPKASALRIAYSPLSVALDSFGRA